MKKTRCIIALVAAMFAVGAMLFVACQKDEESQRVIDASELQRKVSNSAPTELLVAINENGKIRYNFDLDEFSDALFTETSTYVVESFEILDSIFPEKTGEVEIHMVLFNVVDDTPESIWFPISKIDDNYYLDMTDSPNDNNGRRIRCIPKDGCKGGCERLYDGQGRFKGCRCFDSSQGGYCKEGTFADDMVESIGNALAKIIKNLPPIIVL